MHFNKLKVKNQQIEEAIEFARKIGFLGGDQNAESTAYAKATTQQIGMNILFGYLDSLLEISAFPEVDVVLDLTYDTLENLPVALAYEFMAGLNSGYEVEKNVEIAQKTLAAYLILLAVNEENSKITVIRPDDIELEDTYDASTWAGCQINVGETLVKVDLLQAAQSCVSFDGKDFVILARRVIETYQFITGKNLEEYGLDSLNATI